MTLMMKVRWTPRALQLTLNWFFTPWMGAGIRMSEISSDFRKVKVEMPLTFYNRNYVGVHYGGSIYSMCDPIYMLQLINILGPSYVVWDMAAAIQYKSPGKGTLHADFVIEDDLVKLLHRLVPGEKKVFDLDVAVKDADGNIVASVVKTTYVKRKPLPTSKL